ncbi:MAG: hypothetical protein ACYC8T_28755 [Myxococcaceae bacterium]
MKTSWIFGGIVGVGVLLVALALAARISGPARLEARALERGWGTVELKIREFG